MSENTGAARDIDGSRPFIGDTLPGLHPQGILLVANRGVERERVARRLRHQQRDLETRRYKLQQLKK